MSDLSSALQAAFPSDMSWLPALPTVMTLLNSHNFMTGVAVAAILVAAMLASSIFRNTALAMAGGMVILLYAQGGIAGLLTASRSFEAEVRAVPDFSQGMVVGMALTTALLMLLRQRPAT